MMLSYAFNGMHLPIARLMFEIFLDLVGKCLHAISPWLFCIWVDKTSLVAALSGHRLCSIQIGPLSLVVLLFRNFKIRVLSHWRRSEHVKLGFRRK